MQIRLAFFSCASLPDDLTALMDSLPFGADERARLLGIKNAKAQRESLAALLALRSLCASDDLTIFRTEHGKPCFSAVGAPHFSLSHAGGVSVAAICDATSIGVDLEAKRDAANEAAIAARYFTDKERASFAVRGDFLALWTRKEASAKCLGLPLSSVLSTDQNLFTRTYRVGELTISLAAEQAFEVSFPNDFSKPNEVIL